VTFTWEDLISRARVYVDDDHDQPDVGGWIALEKWLTIANVEYAQLYRRWVRMGLVAPPWVDYTFTGPAGTPGVQGPDADGDEEPDDPDEWLAAGVLCIIGVAEDLGGGQLRVLSAPQSEAGRNPWWSVRPAAPATRWLATSVGDAVTITIEPPSTATYVVRYIPTVDYATSASATVELPYGCDERLVLGIARRAKLKESASSALLERLIQDADAEANFLAFGRNNSDGPRVRRSPRGFETDPRHYRFV
jgi:hypothetical protein